MGILDRLFGGSVSNADSIENKMAIYLALFTNIAHIDGEATKSEVDFSREYLADLPGVKDITENQWERIFEKAENFGDKVHLEAAKLNKENKYELLNYLIGAAAADGHFDSTEITFIMVITIGLGLDLSQVFDYLSENYTIDSDELEKSTKALREVLESNGIKI